MHTKRPDHAICFRVRGPGQCQPASHAGGPGAAVFQAGGEGQEGEGAARSPRVQGEAAASPLPMLSSCMTTGSCTGSPAPSPHNASDTAIICIRPVPLMS